MDAPRKIKLVSPGVLRIEWDEKIKFDYPLKFIRENSPDAENKLTQIKSVKEEENTGSENPLKFQVENIEVMGNYAIRIFWKDGFSDGIYPWDLLFKLGRYLEVTNDLHQDFEHKH